jgi:hypothetical protein
MSKFIVTFHSHFGALSYCKALKKQGVTANLMPVPRRVSASCGTCAYYENDDAITIDGCEMEAVFLEVNNTFECVRSDL